MSDVPSVIVPEGSRPNLAAGRVCCQFDPPANYEHTGNDPRLLTDGRINHPGYNVWGPHGCGWVRRTWVVITCELDDRRPIAGVGLHLGGGNDMGGVKTPRHVYLQVRDRGVWYHAGDLLALDQAYQTPTGHGYWLCCDRLEIAGDAVRLVVIPDGHFFMADELEVYQGPDGSLDLQPAHEVVPDLDAWIRDQAKAEALRRRYAADTARISAAIDAADLHLDRASRLKSRLHAVASTVWGTGWNTDCRLPHSAEHADLWRVQADVWRLRQRPKLSVSTRPLGGLVDPHDPPPLGPPAAIRFDAAAGQTHYAVLDLFAAAEPGQQVRIYCDVLGGSAAPKWIKLYRLAWTDTHDGTPVEQLLERLPETVGGWLVPVRPGLVQSLVLAVDCDVPHTQQQGRLVVCCGDRAAAVPVKIRTGGPATSDERLHVGLYDYLDPGGNGEQFVGAQHADDLAARLAIRQITPWATHRVLSDTSAAAGWFHRFADLPRYYVYAAFALDDPAHFAVRLERFRQVAADCGVGPEQLYFLLVDEVHDDAGIEKILRFGAVLKQEIPEAKLCVNPNLRHPSSVNPALWRLADVVQIHETYWDLPAEGLFYRDLPGVQLETYWGGSDTAAPYERYRLAAWRSIARGSDAIHYWAAWDLKGTDSSWHPERARGNSPSPLWLDRDGRQELTVSMLSIAQAMDDYLLLRAESNGAGAQRVGELVDWVLSDPADPTRADVARRAIIDQQKEED